MMGMYRGRNKEVDAVMAAEAADLDRSCLQGLTDQELAKMGQDLMRLHRRLGHPSRQALMRMLQDREASQQLLVIAKNMVCEDCQEARMPSAKRPTAIETANKLWQAVQTDNLMITVGEEVFHFQLMMDEASSFAVVVYLFKHKVTEGRNATSEEFLESLQSRWIQYFGCPEKIKLDKEGARRGTLLAEWAD